MVPRNSTSAAKAAVYLAYLFEFRMLTYTWFIASRQSVIIVMLVLIHATGTLYEVGDQVGCRDTK